MRNFQDDGENRGNILNRRRLRSYFNKRLFSSNLLDVGNAVDSMYSYFHYAYRITIVMCDERV